MDLGNDVWGQVAIEASQLYFTEDGKSRFANTVKKKFQFSLICSCCNDYK